jgi:ubiquinone/menaquinone biosynthesis C-methylase UbiE
MAEADKLFAGSIPEVYEKYLVPMIFVPYAADLARRTAALSPTSVLEIAAGTGVVTRALAPKLAHDARYVVTDLNQPMLDVAARKQPADARIEWRQADALALPFDDASFDAVCCQFGVMFFPDRVKGYREARRVLKPGGSFLFNAWDSLRNNDVPWIIEDTLAKVFPNDPPRFLGRTPHGYHDIEAIRRDLQQAGFSSVAVETREEVGRAASPRDAVMGLCQGSPLRGEIEARDKNGLEAATQRAADAVEQRFGKGPVAARIQAHVVVAKA